MDVPLSWIRRYVPVDLSPKEVAHRITMAGTEVGGIRITGGDWDGNKVVVGKVVSVDPHPNADKLTLPTVDLGGETVTVVCGAPNVAAGQKIAFAREGARLYSARSKKVEPLKAAEIRGVRSAGMVCSELELGLGEDHQGILVLDEDAQVGTPLVDLLGDAVLELELTPNRPDCLSILGVAHEIAAVTGESVTEPGANYREDGPAVGDMVSVEIADPQLCSRYAATVVTGVTIGPSPRWLQESLVKVGMRPINNVVDVTNFVMLEYGQPLHAFDLDKVRDKTIVVRAARDGESLTTLDGEVRSLKPPMLTIADSRDAVALAGVMGGAASEVSGETTSLLIESANFDATNTHRTAGALRLSTEASYRFERGIRPDLVPRALRRATQLVLEIAGGQAAAGVIDVYPGHRDPEPLVLRNSRIEQVLGVSFPDGEVERVLDSLGFEVGDASSEDGSLNVTTPYWRSDISIEEDLIEEVARIVGYDTIPNQPLSTPIPHLRQGPGRELATRLKDSLAALGMQETVSYPLTDLDEMKAVGAPDGREPLKLANPMSQGAQHLRTSLRASLLRTLETNRRISRSESIRIFELGRVFLSRDDAAAGGLPEEKEMLVGLFSGPRHGPSWLANPDEMGFFDAKGVLDGLFGELGVEVRFESTEDPLFHPGKTARMLVGNNSIGVIGQVHPSALERFDVDGGVALFEVDLEALQASRPESLGSYTMASRFPESERDLALVLDESAPSASVQAIIERHKLVSSTRPFDVYAGGELPAGKKSIAYRVVFRSESSTLTSEAVDKAEASILQQLQREFGAERR